MSTLAINQYVSNDIVLKRFPKEGLTNFEDKDDTELISISGLLKEVIRNYKVMCTEEKTKANNIINDYFAECNKRKKYNLRFSEEKHGIPLLIYLNHIDENDLTMAYIDLWKFCMINFSKKWCNRIRINNKRSIKEFEAKFKKDLILNGIFILKKYKKYLTIKLQQQINILNA
tara:strand:- start:47 stop:565 length:519 start_codon:yes stop_codon:yes gene_type:complete